MKIVSSSRSSLGCGCGGFSWQYPFQVLDAQVGPCGSAQSDFEAANRAAWARLWAGAGSKKARGLPLFLKIRDVERCCFPAVSGRCSWWPIGATLASEIVMLHRAVIVSLLRVPREAGEDDSSYARRRG